MASSNETFTEFTLNCPSAQQILSSGYAVIVQSGRSYKIPAGQLIGATNPTLITEGSTYDAAITDTFVGVANTVATTINLPANLTFNKRITIADCLGNAGSLAITILPGSGDNIDGISVYRLISNWQSVNLQYIQSLNTWKAF